MRWVALACILVLTPASATWYAGSDGSSLWLDRAQGPVELHDGTATADTVTWQLPFNASISSVVSGVLHANVTLTAPVPANVDVSWSIRNETAVLANGGPRAFSGSALNWSVDVLGAWRNASTWEITARGAFLALQLDPAGTNLSVPIVIPEPLPSYEEVDVAGEHLLISIAPTSSSGTTRYSWSQAPPHADVLLTGEFEGDLLLDVIDGAGSRVADLAGPGVALIRNATPGDWALRVHHADFVGNATLRVTPWQPPSDVAPTARDSPLGAAALVGIALALLRSPRSK